MESDDFTKHYIIRYLSARELVLPPRCCLSNILASSPWTQTQHTIKVNCSCQHDSWSNEYLNLRHTKPTSVRNEPEYIKTAIAHYYQLCDLTEYNLGIEHNKFLEDLVYWVYLVHIW